MTYKVIISLRVDPEDDIRGDGECKIDLDRLDLKPLAAWLTSNILSGDKVSIVFPDTYIDIDFENSSPYPDTLINNFREFVLAFMENSKKPSRGGIVVVRDNLSFIPFENNHVKSKPRWVTFMVRGNTKMTASAWGILFMEMCPLVLNDPSGRRSWPLHSLKMSNVSFKDVLESCFKCKFKNEPITVGWLLESDQVDLNGKLI